jgi:hypothetical protein
MALPNQAGDVLYAHLITRVDLDKVVRVAPKGHEKWPEGRSWTLRESLDELTADGAPFGFNRKDIALLGIWDPPEGHCGTCTCDLGGRQVAVYVTREGRLTGDGLQYLSPSQREWCEEEAGKIMAVVREHPRWLRALTV